MKRIVAYAAAVLVIALPTGAAALGLGEIELHSALNEPLDAEIELLSVGREQLEDIKVALAKSADFARAGLDRPFWFSKLRFAIQKDPDGKARIKITTRQPVREPFLNFLLEVNWPKGKLLREYTVLLDPPVYSAVASARVAKPAVETPEQPEPAPVAPTTLESPEPVMEAPEAPPAEPAPALAEVAEAPALTSEPAVAVTPEAPPAAAPRLPAEIPEAPVAEEPMVAEPAAETLAEEPLTAEPAYMSPSEPAPAPAEPAVTRAPVQPSVPGRQVGPYSFGPTETGDTLWSIANRVRPESVSANQMMLALLNANPDAFETENVNTLKVGHVLRVPKLNEIQTISESAALAQVKVQHAAWDEYRQQVAERAAPAPLGDVAEVVTTEPPPAVEEEARLQLLSAGAGEAGLGGVAGGEAESAALRQELAVVMEDLDSKRLENEELSSRLQETEELIGDLQRLIQLKDDTLAGLQARLAEMESAGEEVAPVAEPMPAETMMEEVFDESTTALPGPEVMEDTAGIGSTETMETDPVGAMPEAGPTETAEMPQADVLPITEAPPAEVLQAEEPQARPTPILPPPPVVPSESFLDSILSSLPVDPMLLAGGLGAVLLVGLLVAFLLKRRRSGSEQEAAAEDAFLFDEDLADGAPEEETETTELMEEPITEPDEAVPENQRTLVAGQSLAPEVTVKEEDPLAEVNVYLAYERFDQAGELVRAAIDEYPDRSEYKLKLLEVHYAAKDAEAFERDAVFLRDAVGEDSPLMEKAAGWWQELNPERNLFEDQEAPAEPEPVADDDGFESTVAALRAGEKVDFDQAREQAESTEEPEVDFDLGFDTGSTDEAMPESFATEEESQPLDLGDAVDFELSAEPKAGEVEEPAAAAQDDNVVDFDLDFGADEAATEAKVEEASAAPEALDFDLAGSEEAPRFDETGPLDFELGTGQDAGAEEEPAAGLDLDLGLDDAGGIEAEAKPADDSAGLDLELGAQDQALEAEGEDERTGPLDFEIGPDASVVEGSSESDDLLGESLDLAVASESAEKRQGEEQVDFDAFAGEATAEEALFDVDASEASQELELSLDLDAVAEAGSDSDQAEAIELRPDMSAVESAGLDLNLEVAGDGDEESLFGMEGDMVGEIDEVGTKLDLAQAYVDMGDSDGARNILNEVLTEGSDQQRSEAQTLLTKLG